MALTDSISKLPSKRLNSAGAMFDPVKMRWLQGNTSQSTSSVVFRDGYEDPTYMTFRIEFGGWGWSVLPKSSLSSYSVTTDNGETVLTSLKVGYQTYDQLPLGLLDMHYAINSNYNASSPYSTSQIMDYPKYAFNMQNYYNAVNWLLMRNEDQRAIYLKTFIDGLYEIQHDHPYMFQKISGLNGLENFNTSNGARLGESGVDISIECIEGLQLKLKSLMLLYRKAAWDDAWQRWILPENMREFTMIIYVFERRTFHEATLRQDRTESYSYSSVNYDKKTDTTTVNNTQVTNVYANDHNQPDLHMHDLNYDLPVYAYECSPCEFVIDNTLWGDSYDATFESDSPEGTTIKVKVKNVQTFYKNRMMKNIQGMMVYDLLDAMDREMTGVMSGEGIISGKIDMGGQYLTGTVNGAKANFLNKKVFWENELMDKTRVLYGTNSKPTGVDSLTGDYFKAQLSPLTTDTGYNSDMDQIQQQVCEEDQMDLSQGLIAANLSNQREENWWGTGTVTGGLNFSSWKAFKNSLKNLVTTSEKQIRVSRGYSQSSSGIVNNTFAYIDMTGSPAAEAFSVATQMHIDPCYALYEAAQLQTHGSESWATDNELEMRWKGGVIDREKLTNYDPSWATRDSSNPNDHIMSKEFNTVDPTERNSAIENPAQGGALDREALTKYDASWATRDSSNPNDHVMEAEFNTVDPTERNSAIDSSVQGGALDREALTKYDASWATRDNSNKHDHIMTNQFNTVDQTERNSATDSPAQGGMLDREELTQHDASWATHDNSGNDHNIQPEMMSVDQKEREIASTDIAMDEARTIDEQGLEEPEDPRTIDEQELVDVPESSREIPYTAISPEGERTLAKMKKIHVDKARELQQHNLPTTEQTTHTQRLIENVPLDARELPEMQNIKMDDARTVSDAHLTAPDDARTLAKMTLTSVDESERSITMSDIAMDEARGAYDGDLYSPSDEGRYTIYAETVMDEARDLSEMELQENEDPRGVDTQEMVSVENGRKIGDMTLKKPSGERKLRKRNMKQMDKSTRSTKKKNLPEIDSERTIQSQPQGGNIYNGAERPMYMETVENGEVYFDPRELPEFTYPTVDEARKLGNLVLNRVSTLNVLSQATSKPNKEFAKIDRESAEIEQMTKKMLKSFKIEQTTRDEKMADAIEVAKAFSSENESAQTLLAQRIVAMQEMLKQETLDTVRELPEVKLNTLYTSEEQAKQEPIMLKPEGARELYNNALLYGIAEDDVRGMSVHSMLSLYEAIINQGVRFNQKKDQGMFGIQGVKDRSLATDLDGGPSNQQLATVEQSTRKLGSSIVTEEYTPRTTESMHQVSLDETTRPAETDAKNMPHPDETKRGSKKQKLGHKVDTTTRVVNNSSMKQPDTTERTKKTSITDGKTDTTQRSITKLKS